MSPSQASQTMSRGLRAHRAGRLLEARRCYETVRRCFPRHAQALNLLGLVAVSEGHSEEGIGFYRSCVRAEPRFAAAWSNMGAALAAVGRHEEALAAHTRATEIEPGLAAAHNNLGTLLSAQGRAEEAALAFMRAVELQPELAEAHNNLGNVRKAQGRLEQAVADYRRAVELRPGYANAWYNLGNALLALGRPAEADGAYLRALSLDPQQPKAHNNRSKALRDMGRFDEALAACEAAIALQPDLAEAHSNLGCALQACQRWEEAIAAHRRAVALRGDFADAWNNLGNSLLALNRTDEALAAYREAHRLQPASPDIAFNASIVDLLEGRFLAAWEGYERRWDLRAKNLRRRPVQTRPAWDGLDSLAGKSILVYSEQGLGDTFQFARYIPLLAARGARVHGVVQAAARSLIGRLSGVSSVSTTCDPWPECDFHCPLLSLPRAFRTELSSIPVNVPYLAARPDRVQKAAWLASSGGRRIGAVWAGNPSHPNDRNRSIPLGALSSALASAGTGWVSLQKEMRPGEAAALSAAGAVDLSGLLRDFEDTAGVLAQLDLLITVDTSVAHLAGAMGLPTWILLPYSPDWRWLLGREDSPWYPSVRLFRQSEPGNWAPVLARVAAELEANRCRKVA